MLAMAIESLVSLPHQGYPGGKAASGVPQWIINQIPAHNAFVSGFLGYCAIMRYKLPAPSNIGIEMCDSVVEDWQVATYKEPWTVSQKVSILPGNFFILFSDILPLFEKSTFLYLDPPYLHSTRTNKQIYEFEMSEIKHIALLNIASRLPCMVAISCYDNELYSSHLSNWRKSAYMAQTRGGQRLETLYMNYPEPLPGDLHDTRFIGENFRSREKSMRRIKTILRKIENLTEPERAMLQLKMFPNA